MFDFKAKPTNGFLRLGELTTARGKVATPFFMPVGTLGTVKTLNSDEIRSVGAQVLLANAYHLHMRPGEHVIKKAGGIQKYANWDGPMLTDSGGFQVYSLSKIRKITEEGVTFTEPRSGDKILLTPEKSIQIQFDLGADIIMAFDDVVGLSKEERYREEEALHRTHRWLVRSVQEYKKLSKKHENPPALFGIVQGGLSKELRKASLEFVQSQDVSGIAIGGLSVGEPREEMHAMLKFLAPLYDPKRLHYLMGVGHPIDIRWAIKYGIDMFDCVLPTRIGRHGHAWIKGDRQINLRALAYKDDFKVIEKGCRCPACLAGYSRAFIRHMLTTSETLAGRLISLHNLHYIDALIKEVTKV